MLPQAQLVSSALLASVVLYGAYSDWRWRRLPNWLTLGGGALGLLVALIGGALQGGLPGAFAGGRDSLFGWLLGFALLFLPFALGGMGAGDVKLLGAVGAIRGPYFVLVAFIYTAIIGGVASIILLAYQGRLLPLVRGALGWLWLALRCIVIYRTLPPLGRLKPPAAAGEDGSAGKPHLASIPYGLAIAAGSLLALALGY